MYELTCRIKDVSFDYFSGNPLVTLYMNERQTALDMVDTLREYDKLSVKIDIYKAKRSLDANAYCFVLIGKIAEKTNISKDEIYRRAIKEVGGNYDVVCVQNKAVESLCHAWQKNGLGWQTDTMPSKIDGCTNVLLYYGSSSYDVEQMQRLISIVQQDCDSLGIETKTQAEIDSLLNSWRGK